MSKNETRGRKMNSEFTDEDFIHNHCLDIKHLYASAFDEYWVGVSDLESAKYNAFNKVVDNLMMYTQGRGSYDACAGIVRAVLTEDASKISIEK